MKAIQLLAGVLVCVLMAGCSTASWQEWRKKNDSGYFSKVDQQADPQAPMLIRVLGYGAMSNDKNLSEAQRRLLAIRASQMDAYRAMAERVYGTMLEGGTSVRDMVVENDHLRTWVETSLHGARVVSSSLLPDGSVETVLEMVIDQGFRNCLQTSGNQRMNVDCRVLPAMDVSQLAPLQTAEDRGAAVRSGSSGTAASGTTRSGFYFIE